MKASENERRDWFIIPLILGIGFLCVIVAGQWALRFSPSWKLNTNMDSNLNPNSDFLTRRPSGFIEPVDPSILTEPVWINLFLTPGASFVTGTPFPKATITSITSSLATSTIAQTPFQTSTPISIASATNVVIASPTNTFVYYPPTSSSTSKPKPTATSTVSPIYTSTPTTVATSTQTPTSSTATFTLTSTPTPTPTVTNTSPPTATYTPTTTPTSTATASCSTTITITGTSGSYPISSGLTCFEYTNPTFANGGIFQITSTGASGMVNGNSCPGQSISNGSTANYGVAQSGGLMTFRFTGSAGILDINVSDWTTYPSCP
jgi:hypothetical protein